MKTTTYRDGIITFEIPDDWIEDMDEDGNGLFYEDTPKGGLLQLAIRTVSNPNPVTSEMLIALLTNLSLAGNVNNKSLETLPNGNVLLSYVTSTREAGRLLVIYFWLIGNPVPPHHARIANFSYTAEAVSAANNDTQNLIAQLTQSIKQARFAETLSEQRDVSVPGEENAKEGNETQGSEKHLGTEGADADDSD